MTQSTEQLTHLVILDNNLGSSGTPSWDRLYYIHVMTVLLWQSLAATKKFEQHIQDTPMRL